MGDAPRPAQPATVCSGQRARRDQRRGLLVRDGQDHRVGGDRGALRQRDAEAAVLRPARWRKPWCSGRPGRRAWPAGSRPRRRAARPAAASGTPMSAALFLPSRPVFTTTAASASEASSPAMFSAETENRSHSARRVRSLCPCLASQSPKRCVSAAGSAGSTKRIASAGRATEARSARDRNGYRPRAGSICSGPGSAVLRSLAFLPSRGQDGHVEPVLQRGVPGHAEPVQQAAVGRAAAEEDVLAGVDGQAVPAERAGRAAQPGPGLEQGDVGARLGERDRGGDAGQPPADHRDLDNSSDPPRQGAHRDHGFLPRGQGNPAVRTAAGCAAIRSSSWR